LEGEPSETVRVLATLDMVDALRLYMVFLCSTPVETEAILIFSMGTVGLSMPESSMGTTSLPNLKLPNIFPHIEDFLLTGGRAGVGARTVIDILIVLCEIVEIRY
jgi:hypothetical protein